MFKKFNRLAEQAATSVSRRQFLGRLGRGAAAAAAVMGGLLVFPGDAHALSCVGGFEPTVCPGGGKRNSLRRTICCPPGSTCAKVKGQFVCQSSGSIG